MSNTNSSNPSSRGRIAQVLAQARASLKEPSRPYTPTSLDDKTALSQYENSINSYNVSSSNRINSLLTNNILSKNKSLKRSSNNLLETNKDIDGSINSLSSKSNKGQQQQQQSVKDENSSFKILINEINDIINTLEYETIAFTGEEINEKIRMEGLLSNLTHPIDKLSKIIKTELKFSSDGIIR